MEEAERIVSFDDMMEALAAVERRELLVALLEREQRDDSTVDIAAPDSQGDTVGDRVMIRHAHVPKLVDHGFIECDEEATEVTKGPNFDDIRPLLQLLDDHEDELPPGWLRHEDELPPDWLHHGDELSADWS